MQRSRVVTLSSLAWLGLLMGIPGLSLIAEPATCASGWRLVARGGAVEIRGATPRPVQKPGAAADPWALSATGAHLGSGFRPGEPQPLLP